MMMVVWEVYIPAGYHPITQLTTFLVPRWRSRLRSTSGGSAEREEKGKEVGFCKGVILGEG